MVHQFIEVMKISVQKSITSRSFFQFVEESSTFLTLLKRIDEFIAVRKVIVAKRVKKENSRSYSPPSTVSQKYQVRWQYVSPERMPLNSFNTSSDLYKQNTKIGVMTPNSS